MVTNEVKRKKWIFNFKVYPDGREYLESGLLIGQEILKPKEKKQKEAVKEIKTATLEEY